MKFPNIKRVVVEDFPPEQKQTIEKLGTILNPFVDNFGQLVNNGIDFDNLNQQLITINFMTDSTGQPLGGMQFKTRIKTNINGLIVASVKQAVGQGILTQAPFINFSQNGSIITVTYIVGLEKETKYTISLLLI